VTDFGRIAQTKPIFIFWSKILLRNPS